MERWCNACGSAFTPVPQAPFQTYCSQKPCQRERKRLWQQAKRKSDPDYLDNQLGAQRAWSKRNPDYWRAYRQRNPDYEEKNRLQQRIRNEKTKSVAKMDESTDCTILEAGLYRLVRLLPGEGTKTGGWIVQIAVVTQHEAQPGGIAKRGRVR